MAAHEVHPVSRFDALRQDLLQIVIARGHRKLDEPVRLASGGFSRHFIDGKAALARGEHLALACETIIELLAQEQTEFDAVGGLTLGADQFAHGVAVIARREWFVVRKEPKGRGTNRLIEGARLGPGVRVVLVDDVVSTGGSIHKAHDAVAETGAAIVFATALVDRGVTASRFFAERDVPYRPLLTYEDFGIEPVSDGSAQPPPH